MLSANLMLLEDTLALHKYRFLRTVETWKYSSRSMGNVKAMKGCATCEHE